MPAVAAAAAAAPVQQAQAASGADQGQDHVPSTHELRALRLHDLVPAASGAAASGAAALDAAASDGTATHAAASDCAASDGAALDAGLCSLSELKRLVQGHASALAAIRPERLKGEGGDKLKAELLEAAAAMHGFGEAVLRMVLSTTAAVPAAAGAVGAPPAPETPTSTAVTPPAAAAAAAAEMRRRSSASLSGRRSRPLSGGGNAAAGAAIVPLGAELGRREGCRLSSQQEAEQAVSVLQRVVSLSRPTSSAGFGSRRGSAGGLSMAGVSFAALPAQQLRLRRSTAGGTPARRLSAERQAADVLAAAATAVAVECGEAAVAAAAAAAAGEAAAAGVAATEAEGVEEAQSPSRRSYADVLLSNLQSQGIQRIVYRQQRPRSIVLVGTPPARRDWRARAGAQLRSGAAR